MTALTLFHIQTYVHLWLVDELFGHVALVISNLLSAIAAVEDEAAGPWDLLGEELAGAIHSVHL